MIYTWLRSLFIEFSERVAKQTLHHGILLIGTEGLGKLALCQALAKRLLCMQQSSQEACGHCKSCLLIDAGSHPDLMQLQTEKSQLGIDVVRGAINKLSQTAQLSGNQVLVIEQIEQMSPAASNALLKTLEEPTNNTYLLLTSNAPERLLPTILSRCEKHRVAVPSLEQANQYIVQQGYEKLDKASLQAYDMSPLRYVSAKNDQESIAFEVFSEKLLALRNGQISSEALASSWQTHAHTICMWLGQRACNDYAENMQANYYQLYQACITASKKLHHAGLNKTLILQVLFDQYRALPSVQ